MSSDRETTDILRLLAAQVPLSLWRFTLELRRSTTTWSHLLMAETQLVPTSSRSTRSSEESNWLPESSPPSPTSPKSSSSAPRSTDKELSISSDNTPDALLPPHPDGSQEPLPISWPRNSKSPDSSLSPTPNPTTKQSLKPHTSTSPPLLSATLTLLLSSWMLLFHAVTGHQRLLLLSSGCLQEKSRFSGELSRLTRNGRNLLISSLPEISNSSESSKNKLERKRKKLERNRLPRMRIRKLPPRTFLQNNGDLYPFIHSFII